MPIFPPIIVISFILSTLGTLLYAYNSVAVNGISALKVFVKNIINSLEIDKKQEFTHYVFVNISKHNTIFSKTCFCDRLVFLLKNLSKKYFNNRLLKLIFLYCDIFQRFFVNLSVSFQYLYNRVLK